MRTLPTTSIEYLTHHWPVVTGCSFGCPWCWARKNANVRPICHAYTYRNEGDDWVEGRFDQPILHPGRLDFPLRRKKPARIGVCFTGDLFGPEVPEEHIRRAFRVMASAPWHNYLVLTKRANRMNLWLSATDSLPYDDLTVRPFPPRTAWLGVSVTTQAEADERIPLLLATPAARRWVSIEPMLGWVGLRDFLRCYAGGRPHGNHPRCSQHAVALDWVVVGSIDHPSTQYPAPRREWIDGIVEQCGAAGIPCWVKNNARKRYPDADWPQEMPT
jgi:protein gp37